MSQTNILLESGTNELEIVEFYIDEFDVDEDKPYRGYFGVNVAKVLEIIRLPKVTEIPNPPHPSVVGTFNLRSRVIPLIDLSTWLGKQMSRKLPPKVIVSEFNRVTNAFLVSGVTRIHRLSWEQVEPPNNYVASVSSNSFTGVVKFDDRILLLLDMEQIIWDLNPNLAMHLTSEDEARLGQEDDTAIKALVVDDSNSIRKMIVNVLDRDGYDVVQDINGQQAWNRLLDMKRRSIEEKRSIFDFVKLIVSDIEMPSMDGHNLCKRCKDDSVLKAVPFILFSSLINERLFHKGESVGADEQVTKPEIALLTKKAKELIDRMVR